MTFHVNPIELKDGEADPAEVVTKALEDLQASVKAIEAKSADRINALEARLNRPGQHQANEDNGGEIERKAFVNFLRVGKAGMEVEEQKALRVSVDTAGGYLAPEQFTTEFVRDLVEFSPIRAIASVKQTSAREVTLPKRTGITNAKWKGENAASESSEPAFGQLEIPVKEITTHVDVSNQLLEDSVVDVEAEVRLALAEDFGAKEGTAFLKGDGNLQPMGILTAEGIAEIVNGHAANLDPDALIALMYALPAAYRNRGTWLMNGTTLAAIRKLKDGHGNYLWQPSYQAGQPETILGRPVVEAVDMADIAEDAVPLVFGDFSTAYRIVDRIELEVRPNPYLLATEGMTRFHARRRVGAGVIQPKALRKLVMSA